MKILKKLSKFYGRVDKTLFAIWLVVYIGGICIGALFMLRIRDKGQIDPKAWTDVATPEPTPEVKTYKFYWDGKHATGDGAEYISEPLASDYCAPGPGVVDVWYNQNGQMAGVTCTPQK